MIRIVKARAADAAELAQVSERAFDCNVDHGAPEPGGPQGYKSAEWQAWMMRQSDYYKVLEEDRIAGGLIVLRKAPREYELARLFIDPDFQGQGIGTQAVQFLWDSYPLTKRWTLDTPAWNQRARRFYAKLGFVEIGRDRRGLVLFERRIAI
ncbi:MAG: GNAT family N-acetyltransferase [Anaerolineae bacterium]|jgi:RimJ/RimL family protein N-acetyltransferase